MRTLSLFQKILVAMLVIALFPLLASSIILSENLGSIREKLSGKITELADHQASASLELRARQVADSVTDFLKRCESDLKLAAELPQSPHILQAFYDSRIGEIWHRKGAKEVHEWIHLYSSLAIIDQNGKETFVIRNGQILPPAKLRNVSNPANTEYLSEDYFARTKQLNKGEIYVSRLTGFHLLKEEQLAGAAEPELAFGGKEYQGVVRFGTPIFKGGRFAGMVLLSLDHRHLMEFTQHIDPGKNQTTVFPSYKSGNYSFMLDDEGWIITHPKYWDIRGLDKSGKLLPPYTEQSPKTDVDSGRIPFNLAFARFIHPNYPVVYAEAMAKKSGYVDVTNIGGAKKLMAYAPILYDTGVYREKGVFGAITIGFQVTQFREAARTSVVLINSQLQQHVRDSFLIVAITSLVVVFAAWFISRGITYPLSLLSEGVRRLADGKAGSRVEISSGGELGELATSFNTMAEELEVRKNNLLKTFEELRSSRKEIMDERNFKESVLESISSAILTFSADGMLTSINGTGKRLLGDVARPGCHYSTVLQGWADLSARVSRVLAKAREYGREPLTLDREDGTRHFEVGFFPIYDDASGGLTLTIRDETVKERYREEMTRLDRLASLGKLSAGIAHEVRNPLTGISLLLDDLHDRADLEPETQKMMGKALAEIERVERLIAALLNFSTPPKSELKEGDLNRTLQDTIILIRRECEKKNISLMFLPGDLPPIRFDFEKIKQAILNLVKNALEAMPDGGSITIVTKTDKRWVLITVSDTGPGIAEEDLPLIFEPFFTRKGAGTGLGLSITQRIIEEHHGKITVESKERGGTTFTISLPEAQDEIC